MSRCMNFTVFSFLMVSINKKVLPYQSVMLILLSNNINKHSPGMLSLKIFLSACAAAAADYRQIRCRPSIPAAASEDILTNIIILHNSVQVNVKFRVRKKVFIFFIFYIYLKRMGHNLSTNLPMFVYTFQAM